MYKVFIDNISKTYQLEQESELLKVFGDHKFIEAAGGLVRRGEQYLFIKRNGKWDIPKGKRDSGESVEECAVREIEEECGLIQPTIIKHLINTWHTYETKRDGKVLKKTYWYLLDEGKEEAILVPQAEEGISEVIFLPKDKFELIRANTYQSIIEILNLI